MLRQYLAKIGTHLSQYMYVKNHIDVSFNLIYIPYILYMSLKHYILCLPLGASRGGAALTSAASLAAQRTRSVSSDRILDEKPGPGRRLVNS